MLSRKVLATLVLTASAVSGAQTIPSAARADLTVHPIKPGKLYWVEGGGGNSGIIIARDGVILIDAKMTADAGMQLSQEVANITSKPITHVILTHSDGDHVNGLVGLPPHVKIVAHVNNKMEQIATLRTSAVEIGGGRCLPPRERLPDMLVARAQVDTVIDGEPLSLRYFGPAHTSGDLVIYLPKEHFAFVGDLITSNVLVHHYKGGSFTGWFAAAAALMKLPATQYLGGHSDALDTKASLAARIDAYRTTRDSVDALVDEGRTLPEIKAAMKDPEKEASGCRGIPYPSLPEIEFIERTNVLQQIR